VVGYKDADAFLTILNTVQPWCLQNLKPLLFTLSSS
jgi:hypothetical protein